MGERTTEGRQLLMGLQTDKNHQGRQGVPDEYVGLDEAATIAHLRMLHGGTPDKTIPGMELEVMAEALSRRLTLYTMRQERNAAPLGPGELNGADFIEGGRTISYADGRKPITGVLVKRAELEVVIEAMQQAAKRR